MARIGGVNIANHQHAEIALTAVYGVGRSRARRICAAAGIKSSTKIKDLSDTEMDKLREQIAKFTLGAGCVIAADSRCAASAPAPTRARARVHARQPSRSSKR